MARYSFVLNKEMLKEREYEWVDRDGNTHVWRPTSADLSGSLFIPDFYYAKEVDTKFGKKRVYQIQRGSGGAKGGWIESVKNLSQGGECWIEPDAIVCENAIVTDNAQIKGGLVGGDVIVGGNAIVKGSDTIISGSGKVFGTVDSSIVMGAGTIQPEGEVKDGSTICDNAVIAGKVEKSLVGGTSVVYGEVKDGACVHGSSIVQEGAEISGSIVVRSGVVSGRIVKEEDEEEE